MFILKRSNRVRRQIKRYSPPIFHSTFVWPITKDDPRYVKEVINSDRGKLCKKAMVEEMDSLEKNDWDLVELVVGTQPIGRKCMFKKKLNTIGKVEKYKTPLVEKGYSEVKASILVRFFLLLQN